MGRQRSLKESQPEFSSKELVVGAYIYLVFEIGIANITFQKIADRAGIAFSTVRYYMTDDDFDIHAEAFKRVMARSLDYVEKRSSHGNRQGRFNPIHDYVDSMFDWISDDRANSTYLIYAYYTASSELRTNVDLSDVNKNARDKVQRSLLEAIGLELYNPVSDAHTCALSVHACVVGHGFLAMTAGTQEAFKTYRIACRSVIDALMSDFLRVSQAIS